jgi:Ca2+-binding RTX toxin-like protein
VIFAGLGADVSNGGDGNDRLWALARKDVTGEAGETVDTLDGGAGNDVIRTRDGEADLITCGDGGNDVAFLDEKDVITDATAENANGSCETVKRSNKRKKADSDSEGAS